MVSQLFFFALKQPWTITMDKYKYKYNDDDDNNDNDNANHLMISFFLNLSTLSEDPSTTFGKEPFFSLIN